MKPRIIPEKVDFDVNFLKIIKNQDMVHFKVLPPLIPPPVLDFFNHNLAGGLSMPLEGMCPRSLHFCHCSHHLDKIPDGWHSICSLLQACFNNGRAVTCQPLRTVTRFLYTEAQSHSRYCPSIGLSFGLGMYTQHSSTPSLSVKHANI